MSIIVEYIQDIDRVNGQPQWWKPLIEGHTRDGYVIRFLNYFYTWKNETYITSDNISYWERNVFSQQVKNLTSGQQNLVRDAKNFFINQIKYFLSQINGYIEDSEDITFDNYFRKINLSFKGELENGLIEDIILEVQL